MEISNVLNRLSKYLLLPIFLLTIAFPSQAAMFLKLGDIQGESTDPEHSDWINLLSVNEAISRPTSSTDSTRTRSSAVFEDVGIGKELDKSSPKLREALASGRVFPKAEIELTTTCGAGAREVYFKYELTNVSVTSISLNASGSETAPVEEFSLNFEEIKWTYTILDESCNPGGTVEAIWSIETGSP